MTERFSLATTASPSGGPTKPKPKESKKKKTKQSQKRRKQRRILETVEKCEFS